MTSLSEPVMKPMGKNSHLKCIWNKGHSQRFLVKEVVQDCSPGEPPLHLNAIMTGELSEVDAH